MLDLHTHILPAMDDGSRDVDESIAMLRAEKAAGVTCIAVTPHFYPHREDPERFLDRRARRIEKLLSDARYPAAAPEILLPGAEVAYYDGLSRMEGIERLCIGDTRALLIEMPFCRWNDRVLREIDTLQKTCDIQPILAHIERFLQYQPKGLVEEMVSAGIMMQANASFFQRWQTKRKAIKMLDRGLIHFLGTDCHNMSSRKPNMEETLQIIRKKPGQEALRELAMNERRLLEGTR